MIINYGVSGVTIQKSITPVQSTNEYKMASKSTPDIVVIMLGTNDAALGEFNAQSYHDDYIGLIKVF